MNTSLKANEGLVRFRMVRVYLTAFRIFFSYLGFFVLGRIRGSRWKRENHVLWHRVNARRTEQTILKVKGLFIKVGQLLSVMTSVLPESFRGGLEGVQDQVPPSSPDRIQELLRNEFGRNPETVFASFSAEPFASASLAQVHRARLTDGTAVAVKIQHPYIAEIADQDLSVMKILIKIGRFFSGIRGLEYAFSQVRQMILDELDFEEEAANLNAVARNFASEPLIAFPEVVPSLTTKRVLVTTLIEGCKANQLEKFPELDRSDLAHRILDAYCRMIFQHGLYHADPHPGNIIIQPDGTAVFLDFGATAYVSEQMREGIPRFLEATLKRNREEMIAALRAIGFIAYASDDTLPNQIIDYIQKRFLEEIPLESFRLGDMHFDVNLKWEIMNDLSKLNISMRDLTATFQVPKEWILLQRTLILLIGLVTMIDPEANPVKVVKPYLKSFALGEGRDWQKLVSGMLRDLVVSALTIPSDIKGVLAKANAGTLSFEVKGTRERTRVIYALGHQALSGLLTMVGGLKAYDAYLEGNHNGLRVFATLCVLGAISFTISLWRTRRWLR